MKALVFYGNENKSILCTVKNKYNDNFLEPNKFYEIKEIYIDIEAGDKNNYISRSVGFTNIIDSHVVPVTDEEFKQMLDFRYI